MFIRKETQLLETLLQCLQGCKHAPCIHCVYSELNILHDSYVADATLGELYPLRYHMYAKLQHLIPGYRKYYREGKKEADNKGRRKKELNFLTLFAFIR